MPHLYGGSFSIDNVYNNYNIINNTANDYTANR